MTGLHDAAGFVLVGGRSSRMGSDKALLRYRGLPLADYIAKQLGPVVDAVALVGDPARYGRLSQAVIADDYPGAGPVGGVITALSASRSTWNIVTACDHPGVTTEFFAAMLYRARESDCQCLVPVTSEGREQVLCAVYRVDALGPLAAAWAAGQARLRDAVRGLRTEYWRPLPGDWHINLNTPTEWADYLAREA